MTNRKEYFTRRISETQSHVPFAPQLFDSSDTSEEDMIPNQIRVRTQLLTPALADSMLEGEVDKGVAAVTDQISGTYLATIRTEARQQRSSLR